MNSNKPAFHRQALILLVLFYLIAYVLPLGFRQMIRPDEYRYAEIPREMLASGDWIVPRLNGMQYFEKPALGYQLTALSFKIFGENSFAMRLPSALAVALAAAALYLLLRRHSKEPYLAPLATGIFLTSGLVYGVGTFAVLDSQLNAALTITLAAFYFAWNSERHWRQVLFYLILAGMAAGASFLIKGFLAFAVPVIVIVPFLLWRKQIKAIFLYPWLPFVACVLVALPWSWAIYKADPEFWRYFIVEEHWNRFTSSTYDRDPQPFWYFIPVLLGGILPAGFLWCVAWRGVSLKNPSGNKLLQRLASLKILQEPLLQYLLCWAVIPFIFFSMSSCKLGTYILPCFAPIAALTAYGVIAAYREYRELTVKIFHIFMLILGIVILAVAGAGILFLCITPFIKALPDLYPDGNLFPWLTVFSVLMWGCALMYAWKEKLCFPIQLIIFMLGIAPAIFFGLNSVPDAVLGDKSPTIGIRKCLEDIPLREGDTILTDRDTMSASCWLLKRADLNILWRTGELKYALENYPENAIRWSPDLLAEDIRKRTAPGTRVYIGSRNLKKYPIPEEWKPYIQVMHNDIILVRF